MADNTNKMAAMPQTAAQPMPARPTIFGGNDAKRMSFDGNIPQYGTSPTSILSQSPGSFGFTSGLTGGATYNRDRRDSLKNMVHLQDFGTD
ncbi:hypothetical protein Ocin01_14178 [Orchesella cincta]|uniref:Uncharacterized protein n=1 Tax=Orchesella cincta TaxID=48709 RepID=A0A1D2MHP5_ORCCI|nr:hypothetical protein Ocin01_14178 [Orchesella cincta]